jgi:hypothetical protein
MQGQQPFSSEVKLYYTLCAEGSLLTEFSGFRLPENAVRGLTVRTAKIIASDPDNNAV